MGRRRFFLTRTKRRIALAALCVLGILLVASVTLFSNGTSEADEFARDIDRARHGLYVGYTQPVQQQMKQAGDLCPGVKPGSDSPDCANLIETLGNVDEVLVTTTVRLEGLLDNPPSEVPEKFLVDMQNVVQLMKDLHESNTFLIDGWRESDQIKWDEGWTLRRQISDKRQSLES